LRDIEAPDFRRNAEAGEDSDVGEDAVDEIAARQDASQDALPALPKGSGLAALTEYEVALKFMEKGYALMGMRVYEGLLGLKYLRCVGQVAHGRIGMIGHSGGSSTGNLLVRLDPGLSAYVSDYAIDWAEWEPTFKVIHCETVPDLYPYSTQINNFATCAVPILEVPYKYTNGMDEVFGFFDGRLLWDGR
jgi:hypothetical protein